MPFEPKRKTHRRTGEEAEKTQRGRHTIESIHRISVDLTHKKRVRQNVEKIETVFFFLPKTATYNTRYNSDKQKNTMSLGQPNHIEQI